MPCCVALSLLLLHLCRASSTPTKGALLPVIDDTINPALPDGCLTWMQRYAAYMDQPFYRAWGRHWAPNLVNPHATKAVLVRLRAGEPVKSEALLAYRALMVEASASGYHIFFLATAFSWHTHESLTRAELLATFPEDLRPSLVLYNSADVRAHYKGHKLSELYSGYLSSLWFMQQWTRFEFVYIMENDVRYIGASWGEFLDAALAAATGSPERFVFWPNLTDSTTGTTRRMQNEERQAFHDARILVGNGDATGKQPDYVVFDGVGRDWSKDSKEISDGSAYNFTVKITYHAYVMLQGWSRHLMDQLHHWSLTGQSAHDEWFPVTVAVQEGDKIFNVKHPQFQTSQGRTFVCSWPPAEGAERLYEDFFQNQDTCYRYALLHGVKLSSSIWEKEITQRPSGKRSGCTHVGIL